MRTIEEAVERPGVYQQPDGLELWFSPLPNWYSFKGVDCPRCDHSITWEYVGGMPSITTPQSTEHLKLKVTGATLKAWHHRSMDIVCDGCQTLLYLHNEDSR